MPKYDQKAKEQDCLDRVIRVGKKKGGYVKRILQQLDGDEVTRDGLSESPDFLKLRKASSKNERDVLIGIEHFQVDQHSTKKSNGRLASMSAHLVQDQYNLFHNHQKDILSGNTFTESALNDLRQIIESNINTHSSSYSYQTLLSSFDYSLKKHLDKIDDYKQNIDAVNLAGGYHADTKLAFLIDVKMASAYNSLSINDDESVNTIEHHRPVIYEDIVQILEDVDPIKVDYILLMCHSTIPTDDGVTVIALRTGNIRSQLKRQKIKIYHYARLDCYLAEFEGLTADINTTLTFNDSVESDGSRTVNVNVSHAVLNSDVLMKLYVHTFYRVIYLVNSGVNVITDSVVIEAYLPTYYKEMQRKIDTVLSNMNI